MQLLNPLEPSTQSAAVLQDGESYHFVRKEDFEAAVKDGKFLEYAHVHNNLYGTTFKAVQDVASSGRCCILDIDVQGAKLVSITASLSLLARDWMNGARWLGSQQGEDTTWPT